MNNSESFDPAAFGHDDLPDASDVTHEHPDVTGGWLRPAVFGAMDGLVSNFALIAGVAGGTSGSDTSPIVLAGLAGLAAGAFSMAAGEYTSVASQSEFAEAQIEIERDEIAHNEAGEMRELAATYVARGMSQSVALQAAAEVHQDTENAVRVHAREEFGVVADELASPTLAAGSSFVAFALGALIPLLPYLLGASQLLPAVLLSMVGLFACGAAVTTVTQRSWMFGGARQLVLGGVSAGLTYLIGSAVGMGLS